jgi:formate hydrogenlyase subunit 3/multisubunit Na+/H+ antiporter MnhD subunit
MWPAASIDSPRSRREGSLLIRRLIYVAFFLEVGLLLILLPWSGFWEHNYFAARWAPLQSILTNNYVRGAVTGLGVVNLFAGFADLLLVFAARPSSPSGRSEPLDGRDRADVTVHNRSGPT